MPNISPAFRRQRKRMRPPSFASAIDCIRCGKSPAMDKVEHSERFRLSAPAFTDRNVRAYLQPSRWRGLSRPATRGTDFDVAARGENEAARFAQRSEMDMQAVGGGYFVQT